MRLLLSALLFSAAQTVFSAPSNLLQVYEVQGTRFISPYSGQSVNVTGLVTAKGTSGFYIASVIPDKDDRTSDGLYVYSTSTTILGSVKPGDIITLTANVQEYRSSVDYLFLTELSSPKNIDVVSSGNPVTPVVLGVDRSPPTELYSSLDAGGIFAVPNNQSLVSVANPVLQPQLYGLDFWESLSGTLVKVTNAVAADHSNSYNDVWVTGDWKVTGRNSRGGVTITGDAGGADVQPEAVIIGTPLDGTKNVNVKLGDKLGDIVGIATYTFGFYYILPLTGVKVVSSGPYPPPPTTLLSVSNSNKCSALTFGDYNVENMAPKSSHLPKVAGHIATLLRSPDLLFIQEIQDNSGATDDGITAANVTLQTLVNSIKTSGGSSYEYLNIDPAPGNLDGGQIGGNIRPVYLYDPSKLSLFRPNPGTFKDATAVTPDGLGLTFNPGLIDPTNAAWKSSRKPIVAVWQTATGHKLWTVNLHFSSKGGSTSLHGDARPPVNGAIAARTAQVSVLTNFLSTIFAADPKAKIIIAGDFNEFIPVDSVYNPLLKIVHDIDEAAGIPPVERYTYNFDMCSEQLDHIFISPSLAPGVQVEHIHINTWDKDGGASDHDPSVGKVNLC